MSEAEPKRDDPLPSRKTPLKTLIFAIVVSAAVTFGLVALLTNIFQRKQEAKELYVRLVDVDDNTSDPRPWGTNWPREFDGYNRDGRSGTPAEQKDADLRALGLEMAGNHESVTAVIALPAEDDDPLAPDRRPLADDDLRGAAAGILHEPRTRDAERGNRAGVEGTHLGGREDRPHRYLARAEARRSAPWVRKSASTAV